ncbi:hypothetical protein [Nostoc sp. PCC 9305]|uniref:hypothetical protein n=1 Tax=Nostoc sp. PCC 9305 TaxID=296636 RepID=UPI0039C5B6BD
MNWFNSDARSAAIVKWRSLSTDIVSQAELFVTAEKIIHLAGCCLDRLFPHRSSIE